MTKHKTVAIPFAELTSQLDRRRDCRWEDVLQMPMPAFDPRVPGSAAAHDAARRSHWHRLDGTWWTVSWPDEADAPRYSAQAIYRQCESGAEARNLADVVHGESEDARRFENSWGGR